MKHLLLLPLFAAVFISSALVPLKASAQGTCSLEFQAKGTDIQILIGYSKLVGRGKIICTEASGPTETLPIKVTVGTPVFFPRISFAPSLTVNGRASGIQILKGGARVLLDKYLTVDIRAAIGHAGVAKSLALEGQNNGISFSLDLDDVDGFGIAVGATNVTLE